MARWCLWRQQVKWERVWELGGVEHRGWGITCLFSLEYLGLLCLASLMFVS